ASRTTMPLIAQPHLTGADDHEEEFPSVETDTEGPFKPSQIADFSGNTPPPFGHETSASGNLLEPLRSREKAGRQPVVMAPHRSSLLWPLVPIALAQTAAPPLSLV